MRSCASPHGAAAVQSLRRYEPDQVRRISAPQVLTDVPAVSQPLAGDLPGTGTDLVAQGPGVNPVHGETERSGRQAGVAATAQRPRPTDPGGLRRFGSDGNRSAGKVLPQR
jgi:hypothetical protein